MTKLLFILSLISPNMANSDQNMANSSQNTAKSDQIIEKHISNACRIYKINCIIFKAVLVHESKLKVSAINHKTQDYGIGQINIKNIRALKLDKHKLITDAQYSVYQSAKIFAYFERRYSQKEPETWYCRYNVGTQSLNKTSALKACIRYLGKVNLEMSVAKEDL